MGYTCMQSGWIITPSCIFKAIELQQVFLHPKDSGAEQLEVAQRNQSHSTHHTAS